MGIYTLSQLSQKLPKKRTKRPRENRLRKEPLESNGHIVGRPEISSVDRDEDPNLGIEQKQRRSTVPVDRRKFRSTDQNFGRPDYCSNAQQFCKINLK